MKNKCVIKSCKKEIYVKKHGLCRGHYQQLIRDGKVKNAPTRARRKLELVIIDK